jgi:hypothetical protein
MFHRHRHNLSHGDSFSSHNKESDMINERGTTLQVTVDRNGKFLLSWGNPTIDQPSRVGDDAYDKLDGVIRIPDRHGDRRWITMYDIQEAYPRDGDKILTLAYTGKIRTYITMYSAVVPILLEHGVSSIIRPQYFHQSRTGGRICILQDGETEVNILTLLGRHFGLEQPTWNTRDCWREDPQRVISALDSPVAGSKEYMKAYYNKTAEVKRAAKAIAKKEKLLKAVEGKTRNDSIDDIIASLKGSGGGGPLPAPPVSRGLTILGRDIGRSDSRE